MSVATRPETDEIVGHFSFIPARLHLRGREVPAFRPWAPILSKDLRLSTLDLMQHPLFQLWKFSSEILSEKGLGLVYGLPNPHWLLLLRLLPGMVSVQAKFSTWSAKVPLDSPLELDSCYSVEPMQEFDRRVDDLWRLWSERFDCQIVRDSISLTKKAGPRDYEVLGLNRNGKLVGLVCARRRGRKWLICDVMAADDGALRSTLAASVNSAHDQALHPRGEKQINRAAILAVPALHPVLSSLGFSPEDQSSHFLVRIIDETISKEDIQPDRWYVSAND